MVSLLASIDPVTLIVGLALSAAFSVGSGLLMGSLNRQSPVADNRPPTLTERGSALPMLIGRRRIPGFLCWAGDRKVTTSGGGGKGIFGGGAGGAQTYSENGWDVLCVGPASALYGIYEGGKAIWTGKITPDDSPAGTHIHTKAGEAFIYWGEFEQPANSTLAAKLGTSSTWPCICYVWWNRKQLGGQAQWGQREYDIEARIMDVVLEDSADWLPESNVASTDNTKSFTGVTLDVANDLELLGPIHEVVKVGTHRKYLDVDYSIDRGSGMIIFLSTGSIDAGDDVDVTFDTTGDGNDGPNPAHVLWQLLTAPAPYGCAIPPEQLDSDAFEALGVLCEEEHQPCHVLASSGIKATDLVSQILQDLSVMMPQVGDVLTVVPIRHVDAEDLPVLSNDLVALPPPARTQAHDAVLPDRLVFVIKDRTNNYRDMDIVVDDSGQAQLRSRTKQQRIDIVTATDRRTGLLISKRREQEILSNIEKYSLNVVRGARRMWPGQAFIIEGIGQMRVASVEMKVQSRTAIIEAVIDQYSGEPGTYVPADITDSYNTPSAAPAAEDLLVVVQELPLGATEAPALGILRVRAHQSISGAIVWLSADDVTYTRAGHQDAAAAAGELQTDLPADASWIIEEGPVITPLNNDIQTVLDLSGNDAAWRTGAQVAVINGEYFFLRNVTAVSGGWRLDGLIRARFDTSREAHSAGDVVLIMPADSLRAMKSSLIRTNGTVYAKVQPFTASDILDLSTVTAVQVDIASPRARRPLPPDNFLANRGDRINEYSTGNDVVFTWTYRVKDGHGRAADEVDAGIPIGAGTPDSDGTFQIKIFDGVTLMHTIPIAANSTTSTYDNADLVSDFGSEPSTFTAQLTNISGSYVSTARTITITKR